MVDSFWTNAQCWLIISEVFRHTPDGNFTIDAQDIFDICLKITNLRLQLHLSGANELMEMKKS